MYAIKQLPEDFIVKETSRVKWEHTGRYLYFKLTKKNRNTLDVIKEIARRLHVREKRIGFAGNKDKKAVTEQVCSIAGVAKEKLWDIKIDQVAVEFLGYGDVPVSLGDLQGNYFEITVRNLEETAIAKIHYCENYFDEQRFSRNNAEIGKDIIAKNFEPAVKTINNPLSNNHLREHENDYVGALRKMPLRLLRIYVNSYQSYLWNETLAEYLRKEGKVIKEIPYSLGKFVFAEENNSLRELRIPLIGFSSEEINDAKLKEIIKELMDREMISENDFVIRQIPELTMEGELRKAFVEVSDLTIGKPEPDELNQGKQKVKVAFSLPKGSYGTLVIRKIIS